MPDALQRLQALFTHLQQETDAYAQRAVRCPERAEESLYAIRAMRMACEALLSDLQK